MTNTEQSTPPIYKEEWGVIVGREAFILNNKQVKVLKEAIKNGTRGIIWFDKFAISVAHIQVVYLIRREIENKLPMPENKLPEMTPEAKIKARKEIEKIRKKFSFINELNFKE